MIRILRPLALMAITALVAVPLSANEGTTSTQPNIIVILTDDLGYGDLSSFSDALPVKTPNIDRLAAQGRKFTQFYVAAPICSPSRAAILSGTFSPENNLTSYLQTREGNIESEQDDYMDPARAWLPLAFKGAGYATAHVGKWHLGGGRDVHNAPSITEYGYDEAYSTWESPNRDPKLGTHHAPWDAKRKDPGQVERHERTAYMVDKTLDFFNRKASGAPCFVTLWPDDLHTPFWPSPEMKAKYEAGDNDRGKQNFFGVLEEYDRQMGRLLEGLERDGHSTNTIVIFTGDNGPAPHYNHQRNDGMRGMKLSLYEGGIRQPFIIHWPAKIAAGTSDDVTVLSAVDLLPTLASLAGVSVPEAARGQLSGVDMSAAVLGRSVRREKDLFWEHGRTERVPRPQDREKDYSPSLGIRRGEYKLLMEPDGSARELYNVVGDRNETRNLIDDPGYKEMVDSMAEALVKWHKGLPGRQHGAQPE